MISYKEKEPSIQLSEITSQLFANCFEKETRHAAKYGLSVVETRSLRVIFDHTHLPVKDLAKYMALSSSRITRIIDGMVDKKLVNRRIDRNDRRMFILSLSEKGTHLAEEIIESHKKIHEDILNQIPTVYHDQIIESIEKLNDALKSWLSHP